MTIWIFGTCDLQVIEVASQAVSWMGSANYVLRELETEVSAACSSGVPSSRESSFRGSRMDRMISKLQQRLRLQPLPSDLVSQGQDKIEELADK